MDIPRIPDWIDKVTKKVRAHIDYLRDAASYWQRQAIEAQEALAALQSKVSTDIWFSLLGDVSKNVPPRYLPKDAKLHIRVGPTWKEVVSIDRSVDGAGVLRIDTSGARLKVYPHSRNAIEIELET